MSGTLSNKVRFFSIFVVGILIAVSFFGYFTDLNINGESSLLSDKTTSVTESYLYSSISIHPVSSGLNTIYYVAKNGNDNDPGTESQPWLTLNKAGSTATAGDTVYVKQGVYREQLIVSNSGDENNYITFSAYPGDTVTIDGTGVSLNWNGLIRMDGVSYIKISDFGIENSEFFGIFGGDSCHHLIIENNGIYNCQSSGIKIYDGGGAPHHIYIYNNIIDEVCMNMNQEALSLSEVDTFEILNNKVYNSWKEGIDVKSGCSNGKIGYNEIASYRISSGGRPSIYIDAYEDYQHDIDVYNNLCYGESEGITIGCEDGGTVERVNIYNNICYGESNGIGIHRMTDAPTSTGYRRKNIHIVNNIFSVDGIGIQITAWAEHIEDLVIRNNIIDPKNNGINSAYLQENDIVCDHNLFTTWSSIYGTDYIEGDPLFVDPAGHDYHLQPTSLAIDSGSSLSAPPFDYDGISRPQGPGFDMGAYEYISNSNEPVIISNANPSDGSTNVPLNTLVLSVTIEDPDGDLFDWSIETSPNIGSASGNSDSNGIKSCSITDLSYSTTYTWFVNATDGFDWTRDVYSFTTETIPGNSSILISEVTPSNGSTNVSLYPVCGVTIYNLNDNLMTVQFYENTTGSWVLQETKYDIGSGSNVVWNNYSNASGYSTNYWWKVYVSEGNSSYEEKIYHFATETIIQLNIYVDDDFNSSTPGWKSTHFDVIQDGINVAAEYDTVYVYSGTYYENIVINKSIFLIGENKDSTIIDGNGNGNIINISADGVNVTEFTIRFSGDSQFSSGIHITSNSNIVSLNNIEHNKNGILIESSSDNNITNNNITDNRYCGIRLDYSHINEIYENDVSDNQGYGIFLWYSSDNVISGNTINYNDFHGVHIDSSSENNLIYHNNFINNLLRNAFSKCDNMWDNGYYSKGNYWDDYPGMDMDNDNIGDFPYLISVGNQDNYPLMEPWPWNDANTPPDKPTIQGHVSGKIKKQYWYNFVSTDPDGDEVYYFVDWGDGTNTGWMGQYESGVEIAKSHTWSTQGTYIVKVKAKDIHGATSDWETLHISMPKTMKFTSLLIQFFEKLLNRFPILEQIFSLLPFFENH